MTPPKQQLKASAYHLSASEVRKLIVAAHSFRDRCIIKALYWFGLRWSTLLEVNHYRKRVFIAVATRGSKILSAKIRLC